MMVRNCPRQEVLGAPGTTGTATFPVCGVREPRPSASATPAATHAERQNIVQVRAAGLGPEMRTARRTDELRSGPKPDESSSLHSAFEQEVYVERLRDRREILSCES